MLSSLLRLKHADVTVFDETPFLCAVQVPFDLFGLYTMSAIVPVKGYSNPLSENQKQVPGFEFLLQEPPHLTR